MYSTVIFSNWSGEIIEMVLYEDTGTKYIDEDLNIKVALSYVI
jgi:hypothetical protein